MFELIERSGYPDTYLVVLELGAAATASAMLVKFPVPSLVTMRLYLMPLLDVCSNFRSFGETHGGNPSRMLLYSGKTSEAGDWVLLAPGIFFNMARELLTCREIFTSPFSILSLTFELLYANPSRQVY